MYGGLLEKGGGDNPVEFEAEVEDNIAAERCGEGVPKQRKCVRNKQVEEENPDSEAEVGGGVGTEEGIDIDIVGHLPIEHSFEGKKLILLFITNISYHYLSLLDQGSLSFNCRTQPFPLTSYCYPSAQLSISNKFFRNSNKNSSSIPSESSNTTDESAYTSLNLP